MSSEVRSGKSASISASGRPDARYSSTSYTVMRSPRIHALPPRFPGQSSLTGESQNRSLSLCGA